MSPEDAGTSFSDFILAMHNRALRKGQILADNLDLSGRKQLFDAGGGPGTYSIFLAKKNPKLKAIVFDLPPAIEIAKGIISKSSVARRISTRAGNYLHDDFGKGNDVVLLSAVFHSMAPRRAKNLLRKAYDSLVRGGLVVVQETLIEDNKVAPVFAALFSLNMLVNTGEGRSYSGKEIMSWMRETGFRTASVQALPPPAGTSLVIGRKP
jgi:cyclopropane fatty-acyl-phospholipid synthase-like methyltransferase